MGFRFRKTLKAGLFRMTFSKSGIGYSVGSKGARITKKAGGGTRTTLSVPGTGLSYVKDSGSQNSSNAPGRRSSNGITARQSAPQPNPAPTYTNKTAMLHIDGLAEYAANIKSLARSNPAWELTSEQIWESGRADTKICQLVFPKRPVRLKMEVEQDVSVAVYVGDVQIGYIAKEESDFAKKLLQSDLIQDMVCIIRGGSYKVVNESGDVQSGKEKCTATVKISYKVPAASSAASSGITSSSNVTHSTASRKCTKTPFYKRWWFWVVLALLALGSCSNGSGTKEDPSGIAESVYETFARTESTDPFIESTTAPVQSTEPTSIATEAAIITSTSETAEEKIEFTYVLNTSSKRFHKPSCSSVDQIKAKNKGSFTGTREEIIARGYKPCGNCHP